MIIIMMIIWLPTLPFIHSHLQKVCLLYHIFNTSLTFAFLFPRSATDLDMAWVDNGLEFQP